MKKYIIATLIALVAITSTVVLTHLVSDYAQVAAFPPGS